MIISFDLDGTLVDTNFDDLLWFEEIPKIYARKHGISFRAAKKYCMGEYDRVGDEDVRWYEPEFWLEHFGLGANAREIMNGIRHHIKLYNDTVSTLKRLSQHYELIVISNAARDFLETKAKVDGIDKYFSRMFSVTSDFKCVKKSGNIFEKVCSIMKVKPSEVVHIGDHYKFDFLAPKKAGIRAFYLDRDKKKAGNGVVRSLSEFAEVMLRPLEQIAVVDETGKIHGKVARGIAHREGILHGATGFFIMDSKNRILVSQRPYSKSGFKGWWCICLGGHLGYGESYEASARREVMEEAGLKCKPKYIGSFVKWLKHDREYVRVYLCKANKVKLDEKEAMNSRFVSMKQLGSMLKSKKYKFIPETKQLYKILKGTASKKQ